MWVSADNWDYLSFLPQAFSQILMCLRMMCPKHNLSLFVLSEYAPDQPSSFTDLQRAEA